MEKCLIRKIFYREFPCSEFLSKYWIIGDLFKNKYQRYLQTDVSCFTIDFKMYFYNKLFENNIVNFVYNQHFHTKCGLMYV